MERCGNVAHGVLACKYSAVIRSSCQVTIAARVCHTSGTPWFEDKQNAACSSLYCLQPSTPGTCIVYLQFPSAVGKPSADDVPSVVSFACEIGLCTSLGPQRR